jgi:hypothetical protein
MTNPHPITPPLELQDKWRQDWYKSKVKHIQLEDHIATQAARWGADQELVACVEWLRARKDSYAIALATSRRPQPPTLKEQALAELGDVYDKDKIDDTTYDTIRRALEALPND